MRAQLQQAFVVGHTGERDQWLTELAWCDAVEEWHLQRRGESKGHHSSVRFGTVKEACITCLQQAIEIWDVTDV